ncbi:MAG: MlaD family protein [Deltaproteobacteria bacterium]|nr:MlaD family protein [Deltaproteobacteria bacterium]
MRRSFAPLTVGLMVLVASVLSFALFKYVQEHQSDEGYTLYAKFNDALGLFEKSRVQTAGIPIGNIISKRLDGRKARVDIRIDRKITLYRNALVAKKSASLLGEFYLEVDPGTPTDPRTGEAVPVLKEGEEIKFVTEPASIADVTESVQDTIPILRDILKDVRGMTSGSIAEIADGLNQTIKTNSVVIERLMLRVDDIAAHIQKLTNEQSDDIAVAINNVREITEGIKSLVGTSEGTVSQTGEKLRTSLDRIQASVDKLESSLTNVEKITGSVAEGKGTVGRLVTDDEIANNIESFTEDASTFVKGITNLQTIVGLRTEYNYLANSFKTYLSIQLAPRPDKFYLIELVDDPRGFKSTQTKTIDSSKDGVISERTITISEALRFSFMFGKRWGNVTGRFGIKESTGGFGVDLHFLRDRLNLSFDAFDTRSNVYPRVQARAALALYGRSLYLIAGADDVLNHQRAPGGGGAFIDGFLGLQLIFNDQDLKSLLLFGGSAVGSASGSSK